jgi:hypothetical protein
MAADAWTAMCGQNVKDKTPLLQHESLQQNDSPAQPGVPQTPHTTPRTVPRPESRRARVSCASRSASSPGFHSRGARGLQDGVLRAALMSMPTHKKMMGR